MKELIGKLNYGNRGPRGPQGPQGPTGPAGEYIAGEGISIVDNVISATGGANVEIDNQTIIRNANDELTTAVGGYTSHEDSFSNGVPYLKYFPTNKEFRIDTDDTYYGTEPYAVGNRTYFKPQDDFCNAFVDFVWQWFDPDSQTLDAFLDAQFTSEDNYDDPDYNPNLVVESATLHYTTYNGSIGAITSVGEGDQALELTIRDMSDDSTFTYQYRTFCRTTNATWRSFYIKPQSTSDIENPNWQFLIHQFTRFWFWIDPDVYQNAPEINNWYDVEIHQIDSKYVPADASKLDATLCTYQTTEPTEDISDGGVHIVYLQSEPSYKYDGYIYLIAEV